MSNEAERQVVGTGIVGHDMANGSESIDLNDDPSLLASFTYRSGGFVPSWGMWEGALPSKRLAS